MVASDQKFRILSIDGGGIRGIIPCILLHRLSEQLSGEFSRNFLQSIDVLAGTSTGGIIALSLAAGLDPLEILRLYMSSAQSIFEPRHLPFLRCRSPKRGLARWLNILLTMRWPKYRVENLYIELKKVFRNLTLGDLKKKVVITAFDLDPFSGDVSKSIDYRKTRRWKPKIFHNFPVTGGQEDRDREVAKVALYTCLGPTYFAAVDGYVDGGVFANNPSMCAVAQCLSHDWPEKKELEHLALLSLGTGTNLRYIAGNRLDWGTLCWILDGQIVHLLLETGDQVPDYQCRQLLGARYHRLAPELPQGRVIEMDDIEETVFLRDFAMHHVSIKDTVSWLNEHWF